jgi:hypothetical protein
MTPNKIFSILDLARRARQRGHVFNPLFVGPPGVGKSQIVQAWCNEKNLPFIDLRAAYLEAPDLIGFPSIEKDENGRGITVHNIPEFWPQDENWEGVILLEEPNRGTTSVMNTFMQLLTDRKVHKVDLPPKAIVVGCINPEEGGYDVNTMDAALKDRFEIFNVSYDKFSFVEYMKASNWDQSLVMFVESNTWNYVLPEELGNTPGNKYISPRTLSKLNAVLKSDVVPDDELMVYESILGKNVGRAFFHFKHEEHPVLYSDILKTPKKALAKLAAFADPQNYKAAYISITIRDIVDHDGNKNTSIDDDLLSQVLLALPADQGPMLIRELEFKRKDDTILHRMCQNYPEIQKYLKSVLKVKKDKEAK